jgi:hypothetical protein
MPKGISLLFKYSIIVAAFHLFMLFFSDTTLYFGVQLAGGYGLALDLLVLVLMAVLIYCIFERRRAGYYLAVILYFGSMLNSFISLLRGQSGLPLLVAPMIFVTLLINGIVLWYVFAQRDYFFQKHPAMNQKADRIFTFSVYTLAGVFLLVILGFGLAFFVRITGTVDSLMERINDQTMTESLFYCEGNDDKDLCYVALVTKFDDEEGIARLCQRVDSSFYRFTCTRAVK